MLAAAQRDKLTVAALGASSVPKIFG